MNHNFGPGLLQKAISKLDGQLDDFKCNKTTDRRPTDKRRTNDDTDDKTTTDNKQQQQARNDGRRLAKTE